jgi:tetratricopeptide (TPR) repeat protein
MDVTKSDESNMSDAVKSPHRFIVGRTRELDLCRTALGRMLAGRRQIVLISGEPGIGKTCCAESVTESAEDQGALVLWGRCHEEAGAPPYWPWVQILRAYVDASSLNDVRLDLGPTVHDIAALVPELVDGQRSPLVDSERQVSKRGAAPSESTPSGGAVTGACPRAAFLSYASEDADAAARVATSLRAAGIDVWLDQSELRGGETWDSAIKQQIKACALFIPLISAHSNARAEGYFRREWKLAVDRTHDMADDAPFLVPVVIDGTSDANARTPDKFREVQWTRLPGGNASASFVARVRRLLGSDSPRAEQAHRLVSDAGRSRYRIFDAVRQFLRQATQKVPIVLVLDNLHWADSPSLSLLEFLSEELQRSRLLIVGTYRDVDVSRKTPLLTMLGGLRPSADVQRVHLTGLSKPALREVAEQLCGLSLREPVLKTIYEQTDGNPLFAVELIRVLVEESGAGDITTVPATIPAGVNEAISRRLARFPDECNELLRVAAVSGRQFTAREIAAAADCDMHSVLAGLDPAIRAGIVQTTSADPGSYQFTHALIRETIYQAFTTADRLRLHARVGDALVGVHSAHLDSALTRIAHHYYQAAALGLTDKAVDFASRAADSAVRMGAYEDALLHYDHVIEALERDDLRHDQRLARAYILKGSALRQLGQTVESTQVLVEAVNRTRLSGNAELLVDVLLSLVLSTRQVDQQRLVPLLHSALASLAEGDSPCRAKASATLAFARRASTELPQLLQVVDDALGVANRTGDVAARCACYQVAVMALRGRPETLQRRIRLGQEYVAAARAGGSTDLLADAYQWQALNYFESGQVEELEALLEHYEKLTEGKSALHQYQVRAHRVTLALLRGAWTDLEVRMSELRELGTKTRPDDADGVNGAQMFALNRDLGRLGALVPELRKIVACADAHVWQPGLMLMLAETGALAEARRMFEGVAERGFCAIERDDMYVTGLVFCAETCVALADAERASTLYQLLLPYAGQTVNHPTAVCFGAADYYLASLAGTANRPDIAGEHYERALTLNRAMRAWPALARTLLRYGAFLLSLPTDAERALGRQRLREADQLARRLGMARLAADIDALAGSRDPASRLRDADPAFISG